MRISSGIEQELNDILGIIGEAVGRRVSNRVGNKSPTKQKWYEWECERSKKRSFA